MTVPVMVRRLRQRLVSRPMEDVAGSVRRQVVAAGRAGLPAGASVAVGCSSRGISHYATIVGAVVAGLRDLGLAPFCVPAMGSHGSATALGQEQVLARAGITEASVGCPVRSSLDVVRLGTLDTGMPVAMDRHAHDADAFVVVNRVKPHTEFTHSFESGPTRMIAIGLGKELGATVYHRYFLRDGYAATIQAVVDRVTAARPLLFAVGIAEEDPVTPRVKRIVVCDLTDASGGNADGVGIADFITERLYGKIDRAALYVNALAGSEPEHARIPMVLPTDRAAVDAAIATIGPVDPDGLRLVHIVNTRDLAMMEVSAALAAECAGRPGLSLDDGVHPPRWEHQ